MAFASAKSTLPLPLLDMPVPAEADGAQGCGDLRLDLAGEARDGHHPRIFLNLEMPPAFALPSAERVGIFCVGGDPQEAGIERRRRKLVDARLDGKAAEFDQAARAFFFLDQFESRCLLLGLGPTGLGALKPLRERQFRHLGLRIPCGIIHRYVSILP